MLGRGFEIGDGIFILSSSEKKGLGLSDNELELVKPYYSTDELLKYFGKRQNSYWVIYTDSWFRDPQAMKPYPNLKKHLDRFRSVITSDFYPYGLHRSRNEQFFLGTKIMCARKCSTPTFTYTDFPCYVSQTFNVIKSARVDPKFLTAS